MTCNQMLMTESYSLKIYVSAAVKQYQTEEKRANMPTTEALYSV